MGHVAAVGPMLFFRKTTFLLASAMLALILFTLRSTPSARHTLLNSTPRGKPSPQTPLFLSQTSPFSPPRSYPLHFPEKIWQTSSAEQRERYANKTSTWLDNNPGWNYTWLSDADQTTFVHAHFPGWPSLLNFWSALDSVILRSDLIRYLAILAEGGIYADIDTSNVTPISAWIPAHFAQGTVNAIIGVEYDDTTYNMFVRPIEFCQWTFAAKAGHPLLLAAVRRVLLHLEYIARVKRTSLSEVQLNKAEVLEATGPGSWSDAVLETLRDQTGLAGLDWGDFHDLREPRLVGDVLVVPINAFGAGQKHSHSGADGYGEVLARHHFGRSWYGKGKGKEKDKGREENVKEG